MELFISSAAYLLDDKDISTTFGSFLIFYNSKNSFIKNMFPSFINSKIEFCPQSISFEEPYILILLIFPKLKSEFSPILPQIQISSLLPYDSPTTAKIKAENY